MTSRQNGWLNAAYALSLGYHIHCFLGCPGQLLLTLALLARRMIPPQQIAATINRNMMGGKKMISLVLRQILSSGNRPAAAEGPHPDFLMAWAILQLLTLLL